MIFVPYIMVVMTVLFVSEQGGQCKVTMFAMFVSEQGGQGEVAMFVKFVDEHGGQGGFTPWSHGRLVTETLVVRLGATVTSVFRQIYIPQIWRTNPSTSPHLRNRTCCSPSRH